MKEAKVYIVTESQYVISGREQNYETGNWLVVIRIFRVDYRGEQVLTQETCRYEQSGY